MDEEIESNSVDSIVCDPPYGISFMAKKWDYDVPTVDVWKEALRVLKPGGYALIACGTRTQHRMACNIEDAGFEIRDVVSWIYGSGFPKSLNVSKAIDKAAGAEREVVGKKRAGLARKARDGADMCGGNQSFEHLRVADITAPATESAKQWDGWGTALKPAVEFFTLCRKPLSEKTIAANVLKWGTGGINVDGCRVALEGDYKAKSNGRPSQTGLGDNYKPEEANQPDTEGLFPANLIHDGSDEVLEMFPHSKSGAMKKSYEYTNNGHSMGAPTGSTKQMHGASEGSAARFFYCAKASKKDRGEGNKHPTVKPTDLMRYLCRLITPPNGTVLDPYMGSGSTGKAAMLEGFNFIGIELDEDYFDIAQKRINETF